MKTGLVFIFLLTGCAVVDAGNSNDVDKHKSSDDINNYKYSQSFLLKSNLMQNKCDISENTTFFC